MIINASKLAGVLDVLQERQSEVMVVCIRDKSGNIKDLIGYEVDADSNILILKFGDV